MKAVVIGAGVVGVTTAYYLAKSGHEVTVVEREPEVATLASAGNAGLIAPSHSFSWASPTAPVQCDSRCSTISPWRRPHLAAS